MAVEASHNVPSGQPHKTDASHQTGVAATVKTEPTGVADGLRINPWYFKSVPGIVKIVQVVLAIICLACGSPAVTDFTRFFLFVVCICFIGTVVLCFVYLISLKGVLTQVPWSVMELVYTGGATILYFIASIVQLVMTADSHYTYVLTRAHFFDPYIAAGVFALFNTLAYATGTLYVFKEWAERRQPQ